MATINKFDVASSPADLINHLVEQTTNFGVIAFCGSRFSVRDGSFETICSDATQYNRTLPSLFKKNERTQDPGSRF